MLQPLTNNTQKTATARSKSVKAPVLGWNAKDAEADMGEGWALELENMFPNLTSCDLRGGYASHSTGNGAGAVETLVQWSGPSSTKLLAAAGTVIYDASAAGASTSIATGKANARWQTTMINTAGGNFLYFVNGADAPVYYDGSSFTTPTLSGVTATDIINVMTHQSRLWFAFNDSLTVGYLAVNGIAGAVSTISLGGLAKKGGYLMAMGSWTRDGGSGPDDVAVFITSEGQAILFSGNNPAVAASWSLVGVFNIGKPIGRRCLESVGAELIVITQDGAIPLSIFLPIDQVGSKGKALSDNIQNHFIKDTRAYGTLYGWQSVHYPQGSYALFNVPHTATTAKQYVVNTQTGAWCSFTGQNAACWALYNGDLYFGAITGGVVYKADTGTSDNGANIDWKIRPAFDYLGRKGINKLVSMVRPHFTSNGAPTYAIDVNVDFSNINPTSIPSAPVLNGATWDVSLWDAANWTDIATISQWTTVTGYGDAVSPTIRGGDLALTISFTAWDVMWQEGNVLG